MKAWNDKLISAAHQACIRAGETKAADPLGSFMSAEAKRHEDVIVVSFRLVAFIAKHKLSLRLYEELVVLLQQSGVDVGDTDHSRITAREMNEVIAGHGRGQVKEFIETPLDIFSGGRISELLLISCLI